jgi:RNA polymerase sigma-70 factor, ECF subfamily
MSTNSEDNLLNILQECLRSGDAQAWETFIAIAQPVLASAVVRSLGGWSAAKRDQIDDLVQEAFLRVCARNFHALRRFRSNDLNALYAYLRTMASSVALDQLRSGAALKHGAGQTPASLDALTRHPASTHDESAALERRMLLESVQKCLDAERSRDRQIFWLYYRHGLTPKAIAAVPYFELLQGGVETILYRVTAAVRKCMGQLGVTKLGGAEGVSV